MVSISGIRGIFGSDLNPENLARYTAAFGSWVKGGKVVLGRDTRVTGELCERVVVSALQAVGCDVVLLGVVPTPTVEMGVLKHRASGGIIISASHNPAEWNALKLLNGKGEFLDAAQGAEVMAIAEGGEIAWQDYRHIGKLQQDDQILEYHIDKILSLPYIRPELIREKQFQVVVDAVNGAGSESVPALLKALGVEQIHCINCTPDGLFPHNPEPVPEHLGEICGKVKEAKADAGIVVDPDADRLALVMNNGELLGEEYTLALATQFMMERNPGPCATNLSSSDVTQNIARKFGQPCYQSAVGEINVVKEMQKHHAVIGGEGNGGVINPDLHYGRDALVGIAMILQLLAEKNTDLASLRQTLPDYHIVKMKKPLEGLDPEAVLRALKVRYAKNRPITIDGLKLIFDEGWVHMRKSNTEPIVRIYAESGSRAKAEELAHRIMNEMDR